jgi:hypothetical protein
MSKAYCGVMGGGELACASATPSISVAVSIARSVNPDSSLFLAGDLQRDADSSRRDEAAGAVGPLDERNRVGGEVLLKAEQIHLIFGLHSIEIDVYESTRPSALHHGLGQLIRYHQGEARAHDPVGYPEGAGDRPDEEGLSGADAAVEGNYISPAERRGETRRDIFGLSR